MLFKLLVIKSGDTLGEKGGREKKSLSIMSILTVPEHSSSPRQPER